MPHLFDPCVGSAALVYEYTEDEWKHRHKIQKMRWYSGWYSFILVAFWSDTKHDCYYSQIFLFYLLLHLQTLWPCVVLVLIIIIQCIVSCGPMVVWDGVWLRFSGCSQCSLVIWKRDVQVVPSNHSACSVAQELELRDTKALGCAWQTYG